MLPGRNGNRRSMKESGRTKDMRPVKKWMLSALTVLLAFSLSSCGEQRTGTLRVGVKADVANFGLYDEESGRYSGMEIDLAQQICEDLGYSGAQFVTVTSTDREEMLDTGKVDMVIATFTITDERREEYHISPVYYTDRVAVMVEDSSLITDMAGFRDCRVGVMKGTVHARLFAEHLAEQGIIPPFDEDSFEPSSFDGGVTFAEYDAYQEISDALEYGEIDAFIADWSILSGFRGMGRTILEETFSAQEYGVFTRKDSPLADRIDEAVKNRLADGTIDSLQMKWRN